jgi:hypothetical protein
VEPMVLRIRACEKTYIGKNWSNRLITFWHSYSW